jgi:CubicO group peptidase (beta-lactamase class C family)
MTGVHGDEALATKFRELVGARHKTFAVATVTPSGTTVASVGAPLDADYELGGISMGITGMLYADARERREIHRSTTLGELLPLGDVPAASVRLATITTHGSGLPAVAKPPTFFGSFAMSRKDLNPVGGSLDQRITETRQVKLRRRRSRFSHLGFELLGHALASAEGTTYQDLVRTRIAEPLGLDTCYVPMSPDQLRPGALIGTNRSGQTRQPWTGEALGPATGVRASIIDMARLVTALLDGSAPGAAALDPVENLSGPGIRIGAAWITNSDNKGYRGTWITGSTSGFSSWIGLNRPAGTALVVMSATAPSLTGSGLPGLNTLSQLS